MKSQTEREWQAALRVMEECGVPVNSSYRIPAGPGGLVILLGPVQQIRQGSRWTIFIAHMEVVNDSAEPIQPVDCFLRLSGSNRRFDLVEDPKTEVPASQYYSLPDDERAFERSEVINHHFLNGSELAPRQRRHGVLLAVSLDPIPEQFAHHSRVEGTIVIVDQFGREFSAPITWLVERSQRTAAQEKRTAARKQQYWVAKNTGSIFERAPGYPPAVEERKSVVPGGGVAGEDARDAHERLRANIGSK